MSDFPEIMCLCVIKCLHSENPTKKSPHHTVENKTGLVSLLPFILIMDVFHVYLF